MFVKRGPYYFKNNKNQRDKMLYFTFIDLIGLLR